MPPQSELGWHVPLLPPVPAPLYGVSMETPYILVHAFHSPPFFMSVAPPLKLKYMKYNLIKLIICKRIVDKPFRYIRCLPKEMNKIRRIQSNSAE